MNTKIGRNDLCPCGSGKKYKKCCLGKDIQKKRYTAMPSVFTENDLKNILKCPVCGFEHIAELGSGGPEGEELMAKYCQICGWISDPSMGSFLDCLHDQIGEHEIRFGKKDMQNDLNNPDFEDPFRPDLSSEKIVKCLHCGDAYKEKEIRWSKIADMWVCKNYPRCDGAGLGFDIHYH